MHVCPGAYREKASTALSTMRASWYRSRLVRTGRASTTVMKASLGTRLHRLAAMVTAARCTPVEKKSRYASTADRATGAQHQERSQAQG